MVRFSPRPRRGVQPGDGRHNPRLRTGQGRAAVPNVPNPPLGAYTVERAIRAHERSVREATRSSIRMEANNLCIASGPLPKFYAHTSNDIAIGNKSIDLH